MTRLVGRLLIATAVGHALLGFVLFQQPLADIVRNGVFNTISPSPLDPTYDRECAFWFLAFSPMLFVLGQIATRAVERNDAAALRRIGWNLFAFGIVGAVLMPVSGQWLLIVLGPLAIRAAREVEQRVDSAVPLAEHAVPS